MLNNSIRQTTKADRELASFPEASPLNVYEWLRQSQQLYNF